MTMKEIDKRHGGAWDRGQADSYYGRPKSPHMFVKATYSSPIILPADMTAEQIEEYNAGYEWNEKHGDKKDWGM